MRIFAALAGVLFSTAVFAADPAPAPTSYVEGKDYTVLSEPVRPADPTKIEVAEAFMYTCPHCYHFEPLVSSWAKKQLSDVVLVQTHIVFNPSIEPYQRGYYTAIALKIKDKVHNDIFKAIHVGHQEFNTAQNWADFLSQYGVTKEAVLQTYNSFGVTSQINQANARQRGFKISSTPQLVVDGRYSINSRVEGGHEAMLKVAQFLVDKVRAERAATKK